MNYETSSRSNFTLNRNLPNRNKSAFIMVNINQMFNILITKSAI